MEATQIKVRSLTRDGSPWEPAYLLAIDPETCIGCCRCFKACGRSVMSLKGVTEDGEIVALDDDDEFERKIMTVSNPGACIGCAACARACPKNCQTHSPC